MIENTIEDIVIVNHLRAKSGVDMDKPLTQEEQELLKKKIFEKLTA